MNRGSFRPILGTSILGAQVQSQKESLKLIIKISLTATYYLLLKHSANYHISSNKGPWLLFNLEALRCSAYWMAALKKGAPYFKVTEIVHRKFKIVLIFFFQVTVNNYHYDILSYIFQNYRFFFFFSFFMFSLFVYLFHIHFHLVLVTLRLYF